MSSAQRIPLGLVTGAEPPAAADSKEYWRSLEELTHTEEVQQLLSEDPARPDGDTPQGLNRRRFLSLLGASLALAGLSGCFYRPRELILPYVNQPEGETPGNPQYY